MISKYHCALYRSTECPNGNWTRFNNNCYWLNDLKLSKIDAKRFCKSANSTLASIRSSNEMDFLEQNILNGIDDNIWIGGGSQSNSRWYWEDGSKFGEYENWAANQPNNPAIRPICVYLKARSHKWGDAYCSDYEFPSICMY